MRAIFMGTPEFSVPVLRAMLAEGIEVAAVVTQPDRPRGRGKGVVCSPVKEEALQHGLTVLQPEKIRQPEVVRTLRALSADIAVVVAFGQILSKEVLEAPRLGCINVHASLLPMYRGAAPIQHVILDGQTETGVTTMFMDEGLDTGDMLLQTVVPIAADETGGSLTEKLSAAGADLLIETLRQLEAGTLTRTPQTGETCYVGMIRKSMGRMDWSRPAVELERQIRGLSPWPSAFTYRDGKLLKIWAARVEEGSEGRPGEVVETARDSFLVQTGQGRLRVMEVQPEGKKRMEAAAYLRGYPITPGTMLGEAPLQRR
ncbi:MAG: methionyl-tRNA formyltransferase [Lachnospiraceae bacterium]|nr:methionyl-tRNA formyltransferase [Lachnospiraceae bacterium]